VFVPWQGLEAGLSLSEGRGECAVILRGAGIAALVVSISAGMFATVLEVVWRAIWQFLDAILMAAWWLGIGSLLRQDHLPYPACRWCSPRPQQHGLLPTSPG
jgi:hypothetical protein